MARKHVEEYFNKICQDYEDMIDAIHDMEKECTEGLVSPDRLELMKERIQPLKDNYMRWSYMMFLLNQPQREKKKKKYEHMNMELIKKLKENNAFDVEHAENQEVIRKMKSDK